MDEEPKVTVSDLISWLQEMPQNMPIRIFTGYGGIPRIPISVYASEGIVCLDAVRKGEED